METHGANKYLDFSSIWIVMKDVPSFLTTSMHHLIMLQRKTGRMRVIVLLRIVAHEACPLAR